LEAPAIRRKLIRWYEKGKRDLPWRRTRDPYAIWISEIMLQQTRVAAVIPYYERFLRRFPDAQALAEISEAELLRMWSGLGYYTRARNVQRAARQIVEQKKFPNDWDSIRGLPGVGDYTAAAIASIAFGLCHAVVDGNVRRVIARLTNSATPDAQREADRLLDRRDPGRWNQALMELGATICLPKEPQCSACPVAGNCAAQRAGTQGQVPAKSVKPSPIRLERTLLVIRRDGRLLVTQGSRVAGFWDLPEPGVQFRQGKIVGEFRHTITHRQYRFIVRRASTRITPESCRWCNALELDEIPLSTTAKKALRCLEEYEQGI